MILTIQEVRAVLARKGDLHKATAAKAFNCTEEQVTNEQRLWAKQVNMCSLYDPEFWKQVYEPLDTRPAAWLVHRAMGEPELEWRKPKDCLDAEPLFKKRRR